MNNYYQDTLDALANISGYTDVEILGGRSEECADLRSIFVSLLMRRYANYEIARMTGLSRQSVTRIVAMHPTRMARKYSMRETMEAVEHRI